MSIWRNTDGKILKSEGGKIFVCEECPCGGCGSLASTYFVHIYPFPGNGKECNVLMNDATIPCRTSWNVGTENLDCYWACLLEGNTFNGTACFLWASKLQGGAPNWTVTRGLISFGNCQGPHDGFLDPPDPSLTNPVGEYYNGATHVATVS